jgi:hypothetical protein
MKMKDHRVPGELINRSLVRITVTALALLTFVVVSGLSARAQSVSGTLSGSIIDAQGAVIPGALVTVKNPATGNERQVTANSAGKYSVPALPPANYEVTAESSGFAKSVVEVSLAVGQDLVIDVTLTVAATEAQVLIEAGGQALQQESSELSGVIGRKQILELPLNGRSYGQLALLEPGVVSSSNRLPGVGRHGMSININGAGSRSNSFLLDGSSAVDAFNNGVGNAIGNFLGVDAVQEFRVLTNAYSAQYGGASGGVISIVTKSGTNEFHGTAFEFLRNDNLDARNFFDPAKKPEFKRNQFGFALGGRIIKNQTFFFGTGEWLRERLGRTIITTVPSLSARQGTVNPAVVPYLNAFYPLPNGRDFGGGLAQFTFPFSQNTDETYWQGRLDHKFSQNNSFFGRYTFDDAARIVPSNYPLLADEFSSRNQYLTLEDTHVINPTLVNTARFSFTRTRIAEEAKTTTSVSPDLSFIRGERLGSLFIGGMPAFGGLTKNDVPQNVFSVSDDMSLAKAEHSLQWGVLIVRQQLNFSQDRLTPGFYTFPSVQQFLAGRPSQFQLTTETGSSKSSRRYYRNTMFGAYVQDAYKVRRNLTLNLGLRLEFTTVPKEILGQSVALPDPLRDTSVTVGSIFENQKNNWAPRVGIAWDPWGDGKTTVRGGFGLFYDINPVPLFISGGAINTNPPFNLSVLVLNPPFPNAGSTGGQASAALISLGYHWQTPRTLQYNLALERELWVNTIATVAYAGSRGTNLVQNGDVNLAIPQIMPDGQPFYAAGLPRRNPSFSTINLKRTEGDSWYNALQLKLRSRLGSNFQVQGSYTFSRSIDTTSSPTESDAVGNIPIVLDVDRPHLERGLSDFHRKHNLVANFTWELPFGRGHDGMAGIALAGWGMSGILTAQSGNPFTPGIQGNWSRNLNIRAGSERPSIAPGCTAESSIQGGPNQYFNPNCFVLPPRGTYGNLGRNVLLGSGLSTVDLSIHKSFRIPLLGEGGKLQFQADVFNILNRANFNLPTRVVFAGASPTETPLSTAGQITSTSTSSRQVQLGLRLSW